LLQDFEIQLEGGAMICPECQTELPDSGKFCLECGHELQTPFAVAAPKDLSFDEKLAKIHKPRPTGLAQEIFSQRDRIEVEHRQLTMMFADMKRFTPFIEKLGPEETCGLMDQVFEILIHTIQDYNATSDELTGDGVMSLSGPPVAHEDHAQRGHFVAVALEGALSDHRQRMPQTNGTHFKKRLGLNSGRLVLEATGEDICIDYAVRGDAENLADRSENASGSAKFPFPGYSLERKHIEPLEIIDALSRFQLLSVDERSSPCLVKRRFV
jgi:class 3 adenylate cyclase